MAEQKSNIPSCPTPSSPSPNGPATDPSIGKTILLHAEQGMGDTLQFIRYAPLLAAARTPRLLSCPKELSLPRSKQSFPIHHDRHRPLAPFLISIARCSASPSPSKPGSTTTSPIAPISKPPLEKNRILEKVDQPRLPQTSHRPRLDQGGKPLLQAQHASIDRTQSPSIQLPQTIQPEFYSLR